MVMFPLGIWVLCGYGLAALMVHWLYERSQSDGSEDHRRGVHYVLVTRNHGLQMEWYLRALSWYAGLRRLNLQVTVLDEGSEDDTRTIAAQMRRAEGMDLAIYNLTQTGIAQELQEHNSLNNRGMVFVVDLRMSGEASKIPYVHAG